MCFSGEVVGHEADCEHVAVIRDLFAVGVREPRVSAIRHAVMQIRGFNVARADERQIGIAEDWHLVGPLHVFSALAVFLINLHELREIRLRHGRADCPTIRRQPVTRDLRVGGNALREVVAERIGGNMRAVADVPSDPQFRRRAQRNPRPHVAVMRRVLALVFLPASDERK